MKVLVIGGAGYIGSHVQKQLLEEGFDVAVFDDLSTGSEINLLPQTEFIHGSILDKDALNEAMGRHIDGVVHLAAKKAVGESMLCPEIYAENNICGSGALSPEPHHYPIFYKTKKKQCFNHK